MELLIRFTPLPDGIWSLLILSKDFSMQTLLKDLDRLYLSSSSKILHIYYDLPDVELASLNIDVSKCYEDTHRICVELGIEII